jgi:FAD/FMN-containing dehydrogenase
VQALMPTAKTVSIPQLRAATRGRVLGPHESGYDQARSLYVSGHDRRPFAIVRPVDGADVARVVAFARHHGLPLAVRSGGHSIAGQSVCDDGITLDLSSLRVLNIDGPTRTAWAGAGLTAGEYTRATAAHGLATPFGDSPSVGLGGITLGGGVGLLHRRHGMTIDNLVAAEVVTADGRVLQASADAEPDLFWAIRGGGGNFGVATRFQYRLAEISDVVGGMLILPASPAVLTTFMEESLAAPEALSSVISVMSAPPMPFLPGDVHGRPIIMALMLYDGPAEAGERAFAPFRAIAKPIADMVRPMSLPGIYEGPEGPHPAALSFRSFFMDEFGVGDAESLLAGLRTSTAQMAVAQLRVLGGAVARVPSDATAFPHRQRRILAATAAMFASRSEAPEHDAWAARVATQLQQGERAAYVNFLGDEGADRVREAYGGATWDRLRALKTRYDPENVFRGNQNIPPL